MKSKGGGTLLKDTAGVSGHFKTPSLALGQKLWNESVPKLWDQSRLMWRFCRSEDYKVFGICLVCKLTTTEDFVLKAVACNKYASEGLQCSYRVCWAWKMTYGIFCQGIFLYFISSLPQTRRSCSVPCPWTDIVLLSYLARAHFVFAFQRPRALQTALFQQSLNSGYWPLTMYICLNQTVPYLL